MSGHGWEIERKAPNIHIMKVDLEGKTLPPDWERWILLTSDRHHDSLFCRQDLEKVHLEQAKERSAGIIDIGDAFCAMQGKGDPRKDQRQVRPEHHGENYLDSLVDTAVEFYAPYADNFMLICPGNHEASILKHHQTDLSERLVAGLRVLSEEKQVYRGAYAGWIRLMVRFGNRKSQSVVIRYHHGHGGGGDMTRGIPQFKRMMMYTESADILWMGHTHDAYCVPEPVIRFNQSSSVSKVKQYLVRTSGYKDEFSPDEGYHTEKGRGPKLQMCYWLRLFSMMKNQAQGLGFELLETDGW